jgi:hypothetical protein
VSVWYADSFVVVVIFWFVGRIVVLCCGTVCVEIVGRGDGRDEGRGVELLDIN